MALVDVYVSGEIITFEVKTKNIIRKKIVNKFEDKKEILLVGFIEFLSKNHNRRSS